MLVVLRSNLARRRRAVISVGPPHAIATTFYPCPAQPGHQLQHACHAQHRAIVRVTFSGSGIRLNAPGS
jgi:hypothetical protein